MKKIFYCASCKKFDNDFNSKYATVTFSNPRDGYGAPIYHVICPDCGYVLSGYMNIRYEEDDTEESYEYIRRIIDMYSCGNGSMLLDHDAFVEILKSELKRKGGIS